MKLDFKECTRDSYVARPTPDVCVEVSRNRSWRRLNQEKPWRITDVFGNSFLAMEEQFATPEEAMQRAENIATEVIRRLAEAAGLVRKR